jgi:hypothetical protein
MKKPTPGPVEFSPDGQLLTRSKEIITLCKTAPEILEALEKMIGAYDVGQNCGPTGAIGFARRAIAKAKGET